MSQTNDIKKHLLNGNTLTAIEALDLFGCFRLAARILDLKDKGLNIKSLTHYNGNKRYSVYYIEQQTS